MEQTPKHFIIDRRTIGHMEAAKAALNGITIGSVSGTMGAVLNDSLWWSIALGVLTIGFQVARILLSYYVAASIAANPINISATQTVSQPEPIEPVKTDDHVDIPADQPA